MNRYYLLSVLVANFVLGTVPDAINPEQLYELQLMALSGVVYTKELLGSEIEEIRDKQERGDLGDDAVKRLLPDWPESHLYTIVASPRLEGTNTVSLSVVKFVPYFSLTRFQDHEDPDNLNQRPVLHFNYYARSNTDSGWGLSVFCGRKATVNRETAPEMLTMEEMNEYLALTSAGICHIIVGILPFSGKENGENYIMIRRRFLNAEARCFDFNELMELTQLGNRPVCKPLCMLRFIGFLKYCGLNICNWFGPGPGYYFDRRYGGPYELHLPYDAGYLECTLPHGAIAFPKYRLPLEDLISTLPPDTQLYLGRLDLRDPALNYSAHLYLNITVPITALPELLECDMKDLQDKKDVRKEMKDIHDEIVERTRIRVKEFKDRYSTVIAPEAFTQAPVPNIDVPPVEDGN